jgi:polysaccharide export outer membrane protein
MAKISLIFKVGALAVVLQLSACKTREKLVYFQHQSDSLVTQSHFTPTIQIDDFLSIQVTGTDPEAVLPFNLPATTGQVGMSGYIQGNASTNGYLVDAAGMVNLPVIGLFPLAGLDRMEAIRQLQEKIGEYVQPAVVHLQIQNYKITVLGDVRSPGTYKIPNERITILEALGLAGDLKPTGERKNVLVIREEAGKKVEYRVDLTSKAVFSSPVYYLVQNDVVYIEPNATARSESSFLRANGGIFLSLTSLIVTTLTLITR